MILDRPHSNAVVERIDHTKMQLWNLVGTQSRVSSWAMLVDLIACDFNWPSQNVI